MPAYDVVILGGGPGGYVAAIRAAQLGLRTALVEREHLGGVCLNWGCIPTKTLLRHAEILEWLRRGAEFGFAFDNLRVDYAVAQRRSRQVAERLVRGVQFLMRKNRIDVYEGEGRLRGEHQVEVRPTQGAAVGGQRFEGVLEAKYIVLASGARPRLLPGMSLDPPRVITYRQALELQQVPRSIVIIGAGPIGLEFAYLFRTYGAEVTLIEMLPHLAPLEDEEISVELEKQFTRQGIRFMTGTRVEAVRAADGGVTVEAGGQTLAAETVLVAVGVQPNTEDLGLEAVGVQTEKGAVVVNEFMQTSVPHIYAIGDVTGKLALAHVASAQGIVAVEHIAAREEKGPMPPALDYLAVPRCTYCRPQIASMGLTERQAREQGYTVKVGKFPFQANGKALALGEHAGFVKLVVDAKYGEILGVHMIGPEVTELLPEMVLARVAELTPEEIVRAIHAHPTLSEVLAEAAHAVLGAALHI
ncbi:MAG: dihydrolipoyl dehydrogenase [Thermoflexus sp.]|uniref:dihydrolipoyl dehydrogenase n=1 Tax=Thermoflexus sp. TaxID=1969742 RepID=UPI0033174961